MTFTVGGYVEMVSDILDRGYELRSFDDVDAAKPHLILRHDIDFDPEIALEIAEAETKMEWQSHYFFLTRSEFYNLAAPRNCTAIQHLIKLGHTVGLHFDAALYAGDRNELVAAVESECADIEAFTGTRVDVFSLHRPNPDLLETTLTVPGRLNTYGPKIFNDIGYVSDSRGTWHHGLPMDHPGVKAGTALQILTHPIWWTSDPDHSPHEKCAAFLARRGGHLDREMMQNCSAYLGSAGSKSV